MDLAQLGRLLLLLGGGMVLLGGLFLLFSRIPVLRQFGNLPGDIRIESDNFTCFAPIVSMILISVVLTIVLNIIVRLLD
ncbi:MAG: DUF2905 domain-containing protein [Chloroflexi bacterium]|nr:DUF2905 domain-containing protein [Chloroflexota bacterium]